LLCVTDDEFGLSSAEIGGIIGGLLFLVVAITLSIVGIMCNRRRDRQKRQNKYGKCQFVHGQNRAGHVSMI